MTGSSPLARGTLIAPYSDLFAIGLIPARAGNTDANIAQESAPGAHPRSRGEHRARSCICTMARGSSPLARGTLTTWSPGLANPGLIPARAGNTQPGSHTWAPAGAHPRSRGEHDSSCYTNPFFRGSSPLARGTREGEDDVCKVHGLIPARAGNTSSASSGERF